MWLSSILFTVLLTVFIIWIYKYMTYKPPNFPPGPPRFPVLGTYFLLLLKNWSFPHVPINELSKKYGPFFGMYVGDNPCLVVTDYDTNKEVLNRVEFDGKPEFYAAKIRSLDKFLGIFFTEGPFWHEQRRFSLRYLRDFGFGRRFEKLEALMNDELQHVVDHLRDRKPTKFDTDIWQGDAVLLEEVFYPCMTNSIMSMFGKEPARYGTPEYRELRDFGRGVKKLQTGLYPIGAINLATWLRYLFPGTVGYTDIMESNKFIHPFMKKLIEEIKSNLEEGEAKNFTEMYLHRLNNELIENPDETTFSEEQLHMIITDYMFPAVTATVGVIAYISQYMLHYPDIQEKMYKEINEVVGRGRLPTLDDRKDLPYTEAVLREVMRIQNFVPLGIIHRTLIDTTFRGYDIPKNTVVLTSLSGAHFDKKVWGDPEVFRPERFITDEGHLVKKDYSIPFGAGKRLCAGETFARNSMFLMLACIAQNFILKLPPGHKLPDLDKKTPGISNFPKDPSWVVAEPRN